jgi:uncharacterized low-complexity protein
MKKTHLALAVLAALSIAAPAQAKFTAAGASSPVEHQAKAKKSSGKSKAAKSSKTHKA